MRPRQTTYIPDKPYKKETSVLSSCLYARTRHNNLRRRPRWGIESTWRNGLLPHTYIPGYVETLRTTILCASQGPGSSRVNIFSRCAVSLKIQSDVPHTRHKRLRPIRANNCVRTGGVVKIWSNLDHILLIKMREFSFSLSENWLEKAPTVTNAVSRKRRRGWTLWGCR